MQAKQRQALGRQAQSRPSARARPLAAIESPRALVVRPNRRRADAAPSARAVISTSNQSSPNRSSPNQQKANRLSTRKLGRVNGHALAQQVRRLVSTAGRRWAGWLRGTAWTLGACGGLAALAWLAMAGADHVLTSERYQVRSLVYQPTPHLEEETLRELLDLEPQSNIFQLDLDQLAQRLQTNPWVAQASVVRVLPDTLEVHVVEREAQALLLAEHFYLVDPHGRPFKRVERDEGKGLPIITGIDREQLANDRPAAIARLARALEVHQIYLGEARPQIGEIHLSDDGAFTLYTAEHTTALEVGRHDFAAALARWDVLRKALGARAAGLEVVYLDAPVHREGPARVIARFRGEASAQDGALLSPDEAQQNAGDANAAAASNPA